MQSSIHIVLNSINEKKKKKNDRRCIFDITETDITGIC